MEMEAVRGRSDFARAAWTVVLAVAAALPACVDPPSLEDACAHAARVQRARRATCFGFTPMADEPTQLEREARACTLTSGASGSKFGAPYVEVCAARQELMCETACTTFPAGRRAPGAPCLSSLQCSTLGCAGTFVVGADGKRNPRTRSCGTCAAPLELGQTCNVETDVCQPGEPGLSCFQGSCRTRGGTGSACDRSDDCAEPLVCTSAGACGAAIGAGEACVTSRECFGEYVCDPTTRVCVNAAYSLPGEACDDDAQRCWIGACDIPDGATTGVCPIVLPDGSACDPDDAAHTCDSFATCFQGTCQIPDPNSCG